MGDMCIEAEDVNEGELAIDEQDEVQAESVTQGRGDDR